MSAFKRMVLKGLKIGLKGFKIYIIINIILFILFWIFPVTMDSRFVLFSL
jgi:hypothetical protein